MEESIKNVMRRRLYGKNPRIVFGFYYHLDREMPEQVSYEILTLALLKERITDKGDYIPMSEFVAAMETLQSEQDLIYNDADILAFAKACAANEITAYHDSEAVSVFTKDGNSYWLDHTTRSKLKDRVTAQSALGKTSTTVQLGEDIFSMSLEDCATMLQDLENYAADCFDICATHKTAVAELESVEEIVAYDYKTGWPEKLNF